MTRATPPFLVFEGLDLSIYDSLDDIRSNLEGIDVEDGVYEAFDSSGRIVHLIASGVERGRLTVDIGRVHIGKIESTPNSAERLRNLIGDYLRAIDHPLPGDSSLDSLIAACISEQNR